MKTRAMVLGSGMVGATMARDLADDPDFEVTAVDSSADNLRRIGGGSAVRTLQADLSDPERLRQIVRDVDLVLGALPSGLGLATLQAVIEAGKPYCDISFMPEDPLELDHLAKAKGVTAVVDCGVSPGLSNMIVGYLETRLSETERAMIYVGGLPRARRWPYQYKAPFAPHDVIEEYTRPARMVQQGQVVIKPALSEPELIEFAGVGTLEAFNTDGLRTLLATSRIANLKEKTLRYPGHLELMRVLRDTGFFSKDRIEVSGVEVRPVDVTAKLLFPKWALDPGEEEFTIMRVIVDGREQDKRVRHTYDLFDVYDHASGTTSMARTTAFPCVIMARMLARGEIAGPGIIPPEVAVRQAGLFDRVRAGLKDRGVHLTSAVVDLSATT